MSPELINGSSDLSLSTSSSSSPGNSTMALIYLLLSSFLGKHNKDLYSDQLETKKKSDDLINERIDNYHGNHKFASDMESLDGSLFYGYSREFWNGLSLPCSIPKFVLNKHRLKRETVEMQMKREKFITENNQGRNKRRAGHRIPMAKRNNKNKNKNDDQGGSGSGLSFSLQVAIQIGNVSIEIPFITWNI